MANDSTIGIAPGTFKDYLPGQALNNFGQFGNFGNFIHEIDKEIQNNGNARIMPSLNSRGETETAQAFFQWNYKPSEKLTINAGLHYLQLMLNNTSSFEPRLSAKYALNDKQSVSLAYGVHSQVQPLGVYFTEFSLNDRVVQPNKSLEFSKAYHLVAGYTKILNSHTQLKTEVYYQHLFNIPVSPDSNSSLSILNHQNGFLLNPWVNDGFGKNYGLELSIERFMKNNFYLISSTSLFNSKYKALDNQWRNSMFNSQYAFALTSGKEFKLKGRFNHSNFGINLKGQFIGGFFTTPLDEEASAKAGYPVFNEQQAFSIKHPDFLRIDLRFSYRKQSGGYTSVLALDIQNVTNRRNVGGEYYSPENVRMEKWYLAPLIPVISYRVEF
jgi:hypothetical protein